MRKPLFTGCCTALVTPFENGKVNFTMLETLLARQINAGIKAVVICGTTGESPTLSDTEKLAIFRHAKAYAGNNCTIIAGTGSNCTEHAAALSRAAESRGADPHTFQYDRISSPSSRPLLFTLQKIYIEH